MSITEPTVMARSDTEQKYLLVDSEQYGLRFEYVTDLTTKVYGLDFNASSEGADGILVLNAGQQDSFYIRSNLLD